MMTLSALAVQCAVLLCALLPPADGFCPPGVAGGRGTEPRLRMCSVGGAPGALADCADAEVVREELKARALAAFSGPASRRRLFAQLSSWAAACAVSVPHAGATQGGASGDALENVLVVPLQDCGGMRTCSTPHVR
jgi:hypothetical protein|eukprot:Tamp_26564.p2 GENE.Tamp_26564~~Tamp_26564.p2  ORF type:complete len:136 (+),score=17.12 Tamp_26564:305-712(+)